MAFSRYFASTRWALTISCIKKLWSCNCGRQIEQMKLNKFKRTLTKHSEGVRPTGMCACHLLVIIRIRFGSLSTDTMGHFEFYCGFCRIYNVKLQYGFNIMEAAVWDPWCETYSMRSSMISTGPNKIYRIDFKLENDRIWRQSDARAIWKASINYQKLYNNKNFWNWFLDADQTNNISNFPIRMAGISVYLASKVPTGRTSKF